MTLMYLELRRNAERVILVRETKSLKTYGKKGKEKGWQGKGKKRKRKRKRKRKNRTRVIVPSFIINLISQIKTQKNFRISSKV